MFTDKQMKTLFQWIENCTILRVVFMILTCPQGDGTPIKSRKGKNDVSAIRIYQHASVIFLSMY